MTFSREPGIVVSAIAHAVLLAAALIGISAKPFEDHVESVPVEVISESELRQITKGERTAEAVKPNPQPKADRVAEVNERKQDAPLDKREIEAPAAPPPRPEVKPEPAKQEIPNPPTPPVRTAAAPPEPVREQPKPEEKKQEEPKKDAEVIKPEPPKRPEPPKPEPPKKPVEKPREAKKPDEDQKPEKPDPKEKARLAKLMEQAEQKPQKPPQPKSETTEKAFNATEIQKLLANKQQPTSTGSTAAQINRQASLGTQTGNAPKLNPSQREQLIGLFQEQMRKCMNLPPGSKPEAKPVVRVGLQRDGSLSVMPSLAGGDRAMGESAMRAIRACAPYRIPERFAPYYDDWRALLVTIDPSDFL